MTKYNFHKRFKLHDMYKHAILQASDHIFIGLLDIVNESLLPTKIMGIIIRI